MKVTIDNILGTASKMNKQILIEEGRQSLKKDNIKLDSFEIRSKINSRLVFVQDQLKNVQSS